MLDKETRRLVVKAIQKVRLFFDQPTTTDEEYMSLTDATLLGVLVCAVDDLDGSNLVNLHEAAIDRLIIRLRQERETKSKNIKRTY